MDGVQEEFDGRVTVLSLDVAEAGNLRIQQQVGVRGHPSAVVLDSENQVTERYFGAVDGVTLRSALESVLP